MDHPQEVEVMKRTVVIGLALVLSAAVGCKGGGGNFGDGGGASVWLVGTGGSLLASRPDNSYSIRDSHTTANLYSIYCVDFVHGWVSGQGGLIMRSADGGASWQSADSTTQRSLYAIAFADVNNGIAVGDAGTIVRSQDGGATWSASASNTTQTLRAVHITRDAKTVLAVGDNGVILRSTDGGKSFTAVPTGYDTPAWRAIGFTADGQLGFIAGAAGELSVTRDGGLTWTGLNKAPAGLRGLSVNVDGSRVVGVGEGGLILRSVDQGATWTEIDSGTNQTLNAIGFVLENNNQGWAVGDHGTILTTVDGAQQFASGVSPVAADFTGIENF
jgi:photosystem II stability/assembly factor-like uncharacterized protein